MHMKARVASFTGQRFVKLLRTLESGATEHRVEEAGVYAAPLAVTAAQSCFGRCYTGTVNEEEFHGDYSLAEGDLLLKT